MNPARQLAAAILAVILAVTLGSAWIGVHFTRASLERQSRIQARHMVNALRISLTPHIQARDTSAMSPFVDQFFGRGDVLRIEVHDDKGYPIVLRVSEATTRTVPAWFVNAVAFEPFEARRSLTSHEGVHGSVIVRLDPATAYLEVWLALVGSLIWLALLGSTAFLVTMLGLRVWLRPLWELDARAHAPELVPHTAAALGSHGVGFQSLAQRVDVLIRELNRRVESERALADGLRARLLRDAATGLGTRRDFDERLVHLFEQPEHLPGTAVILVQLPGLPAYSRQHGDEAADRLLAECGSFIRDSYPGDQPWFAGRLDACELALLVNGIGSEEGWALAGAIGTGLTRLCQMRGLQAEELPRVGFAAFREDARPGEFLERARLALGGALLESAVSEVGPGGSASIDRDEKSRRQDLCRALKERAIRIHYQPAIGFDPEARHGHLEALSRIETATGGLLPARVFIPIAESFQRTSEIDRLALRRVLADLEDASNADYSVAVNLAPASVQDQMLLEWVCRTLHRHPRWSARLMFEIHEYGVPSSLRDFQVWIDRLRPVGCRFGVDHFGRSFTAPTYLRNLAVDYVKVDGSYTRGLSTNRSNQVALQSLVAISRQANVEVYGEAVESEAEWHMLRLLGFTGAQGRFLAEPRELAAGEEPCENRRERA